MQCPFFSLHFPLEMLHFCKVCDQNNHSVTYYIFRNNMYLYDCAAIMTML